MPRLRLDVALTLLAAGARALWQGADYHEVAGCEGGNLLWVTYRSISLTQIAER